VVAAVDGLEQREALAQELAAGLDDLGGVAAVLERPQQRWLATASRPRSYAAPSDRSSRSAR
jgi:hypothetical protein